MAALTLPQDMLQKESFKTLPAKEKEEYVSNLLLKIFQLNPDGITISQIKEATGLTYSTLWHHLELLSCTAQCQKASRGNLDIYHPIGSMKHLNDFDKGKAKYSISIVKNSQGRFICIHEKQENRSGNQSVCSGVSIPVELVDNFISILSGIGKKDKVTAEELLKEGMVKKEE